MTVAYKIIGDSGVGGGTFTAAGDLAGDETNQTVIGIDGNPVNASSPSNNDVLTWDGSAWVPSAPASGFTAGGDLSGSNSSQTVIGIRGVDLDSDLASVGASHDGYVLTYVHGSTEWQAKPTSGGGGANFTASGDLSGDENSQTVVGIDGNPVDAESPNEDDVLTWDGYNWVPQAPSGGGGLSVAGNADEIQINDGSSGLGAASNVKAGSGYISIGSSVASAGAIRLANATAIKARNQTNNADIDMVSTDTSNWLYLGSASTIAGTAIYGGSGMVQLFNTSGHHLNWTWDAGTSNYVQQHSATFNHRLEIAATATNSVTGKALTIRGQNATGTTTTGGALTLTSGTGTSTHGAVNVQVGGTNALSVSRASTYNATVYTYNSTNSKKLVSEVLAEVQTTNATVTSLYEFTLTDEAVTTVDAEISCVRSTGADRAVYYRRMVFARDGGTSSTVQAVVDNGTYESNASLDATIDRSTNTVRVRVTGISSQTFRWTGAIRISVTVP